MRTRPVSAGSPVFPIVEGRALLFQAALFVSCFAAGCSASEPERATGASGHQRVISMLPAATEVLLALSAADRIVARTAYDADPRIRDRPSFGRTLEPSAESLLDLAPDLVILPDFNRSTVHLTELLEDRGIRVLSPRLHTLANLDSLIDTLGVLLDLPANSESLRKQIHFQLGTVRASAPADSLRVLYLVWPAPPRVAAAGTFVQEIMTIAGAHNAMADLNGWPEVGLEEIVRRDPDVILLPTGDDHDIDTNWFRHQAGWRGVRAVREGRIYVVPSDLFNRLGPNVGRAARALHDVLRATEHRP